MSSGAGAAGYMGAIGSGIQQRAALEAEKAAAYKQVEEINRQKEYSQRMQNVVGENAKFKSAGNSELLRQQGEANRLREFQKVSQYNLFGGPPQVTPGQPMMNAGDQLRNNNSKKSRAVLGSYGDWALRDLIQNIQVQNELNKINSFSMGSANVIAPAQINDALHSADTWKIVGATVGAAGEIAGAVQAGKSNSPSKGEGQAPSYTAPNVTGDTGD